MATRASRRRWSRSWSLAALAGCGGDGATRFSGESAAERRRRGTSWSTRSPVDPGEPRPAAREQRLGAARRPPDLRAPGREPRRPLRRAAAIAAGWPSTGALRRLPGLELSASSRGPLSGRHRRSTPAPSSPMSSAGAPIRSGARLLPGPGSPPMRRRPMRVRLILAEPRSPTFPLGSPTRGWGSSRPPALRSRAAPAPICPGVRGAGTGPFELGGRVASITVLDRNRRWWGSDLQLGPSLEEVVFRIVPDETRRAALLRDGAVRVAAGFDAGAARDLARDPLLAAAGGSAGEADEADGSAAGAWIGFDARSAASTAPRRPRCPASGWPCWADQAETRRVTALRAAVSFHAR